MHLSRDRDVVRCAAGFEQRRREELRHLHRVIDELVEILRRYVPNPHSGASFCGNVVATRQPRYGAPCGGTISTSHNICAAFRTQEYRRSVEIATERVEVCRANRVVERVDFCHDGQRTGTGRCPPEILGLLGDRHAGAVCLGTYALELPCELANQIAAGNPRRQPEFLSGGVGVFDRAMHFEQVGVRVAHDDTIASGVLHLIGFYMSELPRLPRRIRST